MAMLEDVFDRLLLHQFGPQWVGGEVRVDVFGRRFMIGVAPAGLEVRTLASSAPVEFEDPEDLLAAMGLETLGATG